MAEPLTAADKKRNAYLLRTYGLSLEDYLRILEEQGGGCAICGKTPDAERRNLAVDHDHATNSIRGLLCGWCNRRLVGRHRLGLDSPRLLRAAADYLDREYHPFTAPTKKKRRRSAKRKAKSK